MKENLLCLLKQPKASKCLKFWHSAIKAQTITAFSLVEMLMALLVASLLMAALAPVMTKKFSENVNVTGSMGSPASIKKTYEIEFGSNDCPDIKTDTDGSQYCEGEFEVPGGYSGMMKVTLIGAGGGGGAAPTAGYTEFTTVGSANTFTVPAVVNEIEATLISGGAGGGEGDMLRLQARPLQPAGVGPLQVHLKLLPAGEGRNKRLRVGAKLRP